MYKDCADSADFLERTSLDRGVMDSLARRKSGVETPLALLHKNKHSLDWDFVKGDLQFGSSDIVKDVRGLMGHEFWN